MSIEVLISAMNQSSMELIEKSNIHSDCLIINQCDRDEVISEEKEYGIVRMISTCERGLSRSRNMALRNSNADICVLCDDDIVFHDGYEDIIKNAFDEVTDADVLVFNIKSVNTEVRKQEPYFKAVKRVPWYKSYSSVHIAFKRQKVLEKGIWFNERFGAGSGMYSMAEDSLFFADIHKSGLRAYTYPGVIADLYSEKSSWFRGFDEKYFYDTGAFLRAAYPKLKYLLSFYYPLRLHNSTKLGLSKALKWEWNGIRGYKMQKNFSDYISHFTPKV